MAGVSIEEFDRLESMIAQARCKAANAALFGTKDELEKWQTVEREAKARREAYTPRALLAVIAALSPEAKVK